MQLPRRSPGNCLHSRTCASDAPLDRQDAVELERRGRAEGCVRRSRARMTRAKKVSRNGVCAREPSCVAPFLACSPELGLKHRASIRPRPSVRLRTCVRPRRVRSCVRPSARPSAPCFSESGGKYRATGGGKEGDGKKERKRRQSEKSGDGGDGAMPVQVQVQSSLRPSSGGNECSRLHVIRVLSFPTVR